MGLRITTWNVNGIRNPFAYEPWREKRTFKAMFDILEADIVVMQETKIQRKDLRDDMVLVPGWDVFFSLPRHKKGYSGVAIYTRNSKCCPIRAEEGITGILTPAQSSTSYRDLPEDQQIGGYPRPEQYDSSIDEVTLDSEGRCVILEFPAFVLIGVYSPAQRDETRTEFRLGFIDMLDARVRNLVAMGKEVILTGDLNIIRSELDTAGLKERLRKEDMTMEDFFSAPARRLMNHLVFDGTIFGDKDIARQKPVLHDICREYHPRRQGMYTCWETKKNARPGNFGSRIDYVLCSHGIRDWFVDSNIQEGLLGSDHCPVYANIGDAVKVRDSDTSILQMMNPSDMFRDGERLREWSTKDLLPLSAKLIPEFDRRQNIKDMFFKKGSLSGTKDSSDPATPAVSETPSDFIPGEASLSQVLASQASTTPSLRDAPSDLVVSPSNEPSKKRQIEPSTTPSRPQKNRKTTTAKENTAKPGNGPSQGSLITGFFKPKTPAPAPSSSKDKPGGRPTTPPKGSAADSSSTSPVLKKEGSTAAASPDGAPNDIAAGPAQSGGAEEGEEEEKFIDPFETRASWSKLLGKRVVPKCEGHGEPCISLLTKKPGVNCGRSFYICPRPLGPSGEKETGTAFRCKTFIWSSDWSG